jgi:hypothetical protein
LHPSVFFRTFGRNILNHFLSIFFFFWLFVYGVVYFYRQVKYVFKNINLYKSQNHSMVFYGRLHYLLSIFLSPVIFFVYLFFIEHAERWLGSFIGLYAKAITINLKLFIQLIEILLLPGLGLLFVLWKTFKPIIKMLNSIFKKVFKTIKVTYQPK